jgi:hypothetical protein
MINILKSALRTGRRLIESAQGLAVESNIAYQDDEDRSEDSRS